MKCDTQLLDFDKCLSKLFVIQHTQNIKGSLIWQNIFLYKTKCKIIFFDIDKNVVIK